MTPRLEHIGDETINNLTMKKVVCLSAVRNVGTFKKHQNYQVFTQSLPEFLGGEYSEGSESFRVNEDNVVSSPNLEDMRQIKASQIGHINWRGRECDLLNLESNFLAKGRVMLFDRREVILDQIVGHDHVGLTIFYCLGDILMVMTIWKWLIT